MSTATETTGAKLKQLATVILDEAYFALAKGEQLTDDQDAALAIANPSEREMQNQIQTRQSILEHQHAAGSAVERVKAIEHRDKLRTEAKRKRAEIEEQITALQTKLRHVDDGLDKAEQQVVNHQQAVECLQEHAPDHLRHQLTRDHVVKRKPLLAEHDTLETAMMFFESLAELKPGEFSGHPPSINNPARDVLGMNEPIVVVERTPQHIPTWGKDDNHVPGKIDNRVFEPALIKARQLARVKRPDIEARFAEVTAELESMDAAESACRDHYVPQ